MTPLALLSCCVLFLGEGDDRVWLRNGRTLEGRVVFEDAHTLVLRQEDRELEIEREEVERFESRWRNLWILLDNAAPVPFQDVRQNEFLASQAEEMGLDGEARVFWWRVLLADREHPAARAGLGHVRRGQGWAIPFEGRTVDWEKRLALARDWGSAWELESWHYALRTNLPLAVALELLLDLERLNRELQLRFGDALGLYDVSHPMAVHVHADEASYPENAREFGQYVTQTDTVHVDASAGLDARLVVHELTHQWLQDALFRERKRSGEIPPWLDEGLAEYVAAGLLTPLVFTFEFGRPHEDHFRTHAQAKRSFDLTRVLNFSIGDYAASSDRALKYAQSYTLVHYLLHGEEGRHRGGFLEFLRQVKQGKGSSTDLKRALGVDWRPLEAAWNTAVRRQTF